MAIKRFQCECHDEDTRFFQDHGSCEFCFYGIENEVEVYEVDDEDIAILAELVAEEQAAAEEDDIPDWMDPQDALIGNPTARNRYCITCDEEFIPHYGKKHISHRHCDRCIQEIAPHA